MPRLIDFLSFFEPFIKQFVPDNFAKTPLKLILIPLVVVFGVYCVKDLFLLRR